MKFLKNFFILFILTLAFESKSYSDIPYFVDFKFILNESIAGKKAQDYLKKKIKWWYKKY